MYSICHQGTCSMWQTAVAPTLLPTHALPIYLPSVDLGPQIYIFAICIYICIYIFAVATTLDTDNCTLRVQEECPSSLSLDSGSYSRVARPSDRRTYIVDRHIDQSQQQTVGHVNSSESNNSNSQLQLQLQSVKVKYAKNQRETEELEEGQGLSQVKQLTAEKCKLQGCVQTMEPGNFVVPSPTRRRHSGITCTR